MRKLLVGSMVVVAAVGALSGCGQSSTSSNGGTAANSSGGTAASSSKTPSKGTVTINFVGQGNASEKANFTDVVNSFEKQNPNIKVKLTMIPPAQYSQKLDTLIASNNTPDVFYAGGSDFYNYALNGVLLDIQPYLNKDPNFDAADFWKPALKRYKFNGKTIGTGDLYGLPKDVGPWAFVYNVDLFKKAGVPLPSEVPGKWTWNDYLAAAKKLTIKDASGRVTQFGAGGYSLRSAVWSNGGHFLDRKTGKVEINQPAFYNAMQFVADLSLKYHVSPTPSEQKADGTYQRFISGKEAMFAMGPWDQTVFWKLPFKWDLAPWPASPTTHQTATWLGSLGFVVGKKSKHPAAAVKLAEFMSVNKAEQKKIMDLGQSVPNLTTMAQDYLNLNEPPKHKKVFLDIIKKYGRPTTTGIKNMKWYDTFKSDASVVWDGKETAKEFCIKEEPKIQALYDKYNK